MYTNNINLTASTTAPLNPSYLAYLENLICSTDVILLNADFAQKGVGFDAFIRSLVPILKKFNRKITCTQATLSELRAIHANNETVDTGGIIERRGDKNAQ